MSHDIRTPMNAIIGFTNIALHQDSVPEIHNCLKKSRTARIIILMDIMMPKMDGLQATRGIRAMQAERPDAEEIPIIAVSANAFAEDVQTSLDAGMNGHISKPLNVAEVAKVIARNLNKV